MDDLGEKLVLVLTAAGLAMMLVSTAVYRISEPGLTKQIGPQQIPRPISQGMNQGMNQAGNRSIPRMAPEGMGGNEQAILDAMQRLQQNPNDVGALLEVSEVFRQQGNYESAHSFVNRALVAAPSDPRPSYFQGSLLAAQGDYVGAAEAMERSLSFQDSPVTRYSLANLYIYHLNQRDKGREYLEVAHAMPNLPEELYHLIDEERNK